MPTFDFACAKCGTVFEFSRPFGSKINPACPQCGSKKTEKQLSPPAVHFKGTGWYKTDSHKPAKKTPAPEKSDAAPTKSTEATPKEKVPDSPKAAPAKKEKSDI